RKRYMPPYTQQSQIQHKNRTKERSNAENVGEVHNGISPDTGFAHGMAQCGVLQPRHELRYHRGVQQALLAVGVHVVCVAIPNHALGLDLKLFGIEITMALYRDLSSNGNDALLQAGSLSAGRRRQRDVPDLVV